MATKASENATMVENTTKKSTTTKSKTKIKKEITGPKKNFILDTNVILHDFEAINNFEENDIYIPFIVLEELDKFKKGSEQINYNARAFVRELDLITDDDLFTSGAELGLGKGKLYIVNASKRSEEHTSELQSRPHLVCRLLL